MQRASSGSTIAFRDCTPPPQPPSAASSGGSTTGTISRLSWRKPRNGASPGTAQCRESLGVGGHLSPGDAALAHRGPVGRRCGHRAVAGIPGLQAGAPSWGATKPCGCWTAAISPSKRFSQASDFPKQAIFPSRGGDRREWPVSTVAGWGRGPTARRVPSRLSVRSDPAPSGRGVLLRDGADRPRASSPNDRRPAPPAPYRLAYPQGPVNIQRTADRPCAARAYLDPVFVAPRCRTKPENLGSRLRGFEQLPTSEQH